MFLYCVCGRMLRHHQKSQVTGTEDNFWLAKVTLKYLKTLSNEFLRIFNPGLCQSGNYLLGEDRFPYTRTTLTHDTHNFVSYFLID